MKRTYVIMCDTYDGPEYIGTDPVDVVSTMEKAEEVCYQMEAETPESIFYWREVISSEGE